MENDSKLLDENKKLKMLYKKQLFEINRLTLLSKTTSKKLMLAERERDLLKKQMKEAQQQIIELQRKESWQSQ